MSEKYLPDLALQDIAEYGDDCLPIVSARFVEYSGKKNREFYISRALVIRALLSKGYFTLIDLADMFNMSPSSIQKIGSGVRCTGARLIDGKGSISPRKAEVRILSAIVKTLRLVGFTFDKMAPYVGISRQYCHYLNGKPATNLRPLVPISLRAAIKADNGNKLSGVVYVQACDAPRYMLAYLKTDKTPLLVAREVIAACPKELSQKPIVMMEAANNG